MARVRGFLLFALLVTSCQQATVDSDQAARDLLSNVTWMSDDVTDGPEFRIFAYFSDTGTAFIGGAEVGTWSYGNGKFTLKGSWGQDVTTSPSLTTAHFYFLYQGTLRHQVRL